MAEPATLNIATQDVISLTVAQIEEALRAHFNKPNAQIEFDLCCSCDGCCGLEIRGADLVTTSSAQEESPFR